LLRSTCHSDAAERTGFEKEKNNANVMGDH
jgi:hypothetical protein